MNDEIRKEVALFRYRILAPLISGTFEPGRSKKDFFRHVSTTMHLDHFGEPTKVPETTLERWYYDYIHKGFDGLIPKRRSDNGKQRKLNDDITDQVKYKNKLIQDFRLH